MNKKDSRSRRSEESRKLSAENRFTRVGDYDVAKYRPIMTKVYLLLKYPAGCSTAPLLSTLEETECSSGGNAIV